MEFMHFPSVVGCCLKYAGNSVMVHLTGVDKYAYVPGFGVMLLLF